MNKEDAEQYHALSQLRLENALLRKENAELLGLLKGANHYINLGFFAEDCDVYRYEHNDATDLSEKIEKLLKEHGIAI